MKGKTIAIIVAVVVIIFLLIKGISSYNTMVNKDEVVKAQWGNVQNAYQRRGDLIPNLVATTKGYANHELQTLVGTVEARAKATQMTVDPDQLTPENVARYQQSQSELSSALGRLLVVREAYPDLKANQQFTQLMDNLEGTENRIATERNKFNTLAQDYNSYIRRFPQNLLAGIGGFFPKGYFEADADKQTAPTVDFGN